MRITFFFLLFLLSTAVLSQEDFLAKQYFNDGAFEKAVVFYEKLVVKNPRRTDYGEGLIGEVLAGTVGKPQGLPHFLCRTGL